MSLAQPTDSLASASSVKDAANASWARNLSNKNFHQRSISRVRSTFIATASAENRNDKYQRQKERERICKSSSSSSSFSILWLGIVEVIHTWLASRKAGRLGNSWCCNLWHQDSWKVFLKRLLDLAQTKKRRKEKTWLCIEYIYIISPEIELIRTSTKRKAKRLFS